MKLLLLLAIMMARFAVYLGILLFAVMITFVAARLSRSKPEPLHARRLKHFQGSLLTHMAMLCLLMLFAFAFESRGQSNGVYQPNFPQVLSNWTSVLIPSNGVVVYENPATNQPVTVRQHSGDSWDLNIVTTNNSAGSIYVWFAQNQTSSSNTWGSSNYPAYILSFAFNGSNPAPGFHWWTNVPQTLLDNTRSVYPYMASNTCSTNNVKLTITESHSNQ